MPQQDTIGQLIEDLVSLHLPPETRLLMVDNKVARAVRSIKVKEGLVLLYADLLREGPVERPKEYALGSWVLFVDPGNPIGSKSLGRVIENGPGIGLYRVVQDAGLRPAGPVHWQLHYGEMWPTDKRPVPRPGRDWRPTKTTPTPDPSPDKFALGVHVIALDADHYFGVTGIIMSYLPDDMYDVRTAFGPLKVAHSDVIEFAPGILVGT